MPWSSVNVKSITADELWARVQEVQAEAVEQGYEGPLLKKHQVFVWHLHFEVGLQYAASLGLSGDELQVSVRSGEPAQAGDRPVPAIFVEGSSLDISVWVGATPDTLLFGPERSTFKARIYKPTGRTAGLRREGKWLVIPTER